MVAAADAAIDPAAADNVQGGDLLGEAYRVVPDDNIGGLAEPDALGVRRDTHLHHQRIRAHLRPLGLEMVLSQPKRLITQLFGQDALPYLVHQCFLRCLVHFTSDPSLSVTPPLVVITGRLDAPL